MMTESIVVVCPGRGTYNRPELGYLKRHHHYDSDLIRALDDHRAEHGQVEVSKLDGAAEFANGFHTSGEHASPLIYACAASDFLDIDSTRFEVSAIIGNSMGWYIALACAGVVDWATGGKLVNVMGMLMAKDAGGGQVIYPVVDEQWRRDPGKEATLQETMREIRRSPRAQVYSSIKLGGYEVLAGNERGIEMLLERLPKSGGRYPMRLQDHAAFHSPVVAGISTLAKENVSRDVFVQPRVPLVDGRGRIWEPAATNIEGLFEYTFGDQIYKTYDFSKTVEVALKEFAPDRMVILGPGTTLVAPVAQEMIRHQWRALDSKDTFQRSQSEDPMILAMGDAKHRMRVSSEGG